MMGPPGRHGKQGVMGVPGIKGEKGQKGKAFINTKFKIKKFSIQSFTNVF